MIPQIRCPACRADLDWPVRDAIRFDCECGEVYRCLSGIPDFRGAEDPYCGNARDEAIAADLQEFAGSLSFEGLLARYYQRHCPELGPADLRRQMRHILEGPRSPSVADIGRSEATGSPILDLGCGSGSALIAFAENGLPGNLVGTDIAMRWLLLARKRLDEAGLDDVRLVCCEGEAMPFPDGMFGAVHGGDVIEHVTDAEAVLAETARLLKPGGIAMFRTPNRLSLTPEPHVGLPFAGWLPKSMSRAYCRMLGAPPFQGIFTRTQIGWNRAASTVSGRYPEVVCDVSAARVCAGKQGRSRLMSFYDTALERSGVFRAFASAFGPVLQIRMEKRLERSVTPAGPFGEAPGFQKGDRPRQ